MKLKNTFTLIIIISTYFGFSQEMQEGFTFLETGKYTKAELFFKNILIDYPNNKTARLCLGRSIGLNGKPEKAKLLFTNLLADYPNDYEVKLNYGEALLWNNDFLKAKNHFKDLIKENNKSFPALLSYANTLSNLKEYKEALTYVNKALEIFPNNSNALNSKKYIYLGYAYKKQQNQQYNEAESLLKENLNLYANDKNTLLNLANLYLIINRPEDAKKTYNILLQNPNNKIYALNGLALTSHLNTKEKEALQLSSQAFNSLGKKTNSILIQQTTERYTQALIWNGKYKSAGTLINKLNTQEPNKNWILALRATLNTHRSDFKKSLTDYNQILENDSTSFDGNLGKANTLKALGFYNNAYLSAENTLRFYKNQKDATNFIKNIDVVFTPSYEVKTLYTFDNGDNEAIFFNNKIEFPISTKFKILGNYNYRNTSNKITNNKANSSDLSLGLSYQLLPNITFKSLAGITSVKATTNNYTQFLTDISIKIKPFKLQNLNIGYKRELQSFNAELLDQEIIQNNFYANYNISTNFNLGWFTQYFYTNQNDDNSRNLLFTSLYYTILKKPSLKTGINYQYITFKNQVPVIYFSPEKFNAAEIFINLIKDEITTKPKECFYELTAATGLQYIENNSS
ncbi:tetratricopeptide repeat protein, partial [Aurantibacter sp.]|uniref:tetratricopeptide repeat protein n=1 Tax=Aurantibacter sp. TaxID=2807103 RepID=UPI0035C7ECA9